MKLPSKHRMESGVAYQLTIPVLVASNYAVQVVRTCKWAGAVDDGRLGGNDGGKTTMM